MKFNNYIPCPECDVNIRLQYLGYICSNNFHPFVRGYNGPVLHYCNCGLTRMVPREIISSYSTSSTVSTSLMVTKFNICCAIFEIIVCKPFPGIHGSYIFHACQKLYRFIQFRDFVTLEQNYS